MNKLNATELAVIIGIILGQIVLIGLALFYDKADQLIFSLLAVSGLLPIIIILAGAEKRGSDDD